MESTRPYGTWKSPISAEGVAKGTLTLSEVKLEGENVYWLERHPEDGGRTTIKVWSKDKGERELLPREYSARSKVHEYGGGALLVADGEIYFVNNKDQQLYSLKNGVVEQITSRPSARFTDGFLHPQKNVLFYVMEEHVDKTVTNALVRIDLQSKNIDILSNEHDFYASPRVNPQGNKLVYVSWDHPNMPWDETELWEFDLQTHQKKKIAGKQHESIMDPKWSPDGILYYVSDRSNWWNVLKNGETTWEYPAEFALPHWLFGRSLIGFTGDGLFCSFVKNGTHGFAKINKAGEGAIIDLPFTSVKYVSVCGNRVALIASSPHEPFSVILYDLENNSVQTIKRCCRDLIEDSYISQPIALEYPSMGHTAHAFYYPPLNPQFSAPSNETPPLIVNVHGGPTGNVCPAYNPEILYWTSRGIAYLDVNYTGSTGYGKQYRDRLKGEWGIIDIEDCTNGALFCVERGLADPHRLTISGPSAGGFTTLAALAFRDVFKAGADYFGVSDLERLALDMHKFESKYLDGLVAPYPQGRNIYLERSPIHHVEKIKSPIIIFQGDEDTVVPPSQSEMMFNTLASRKIATAYLLYEGEGHGFHKSPSIQRSLEAQLYFFSKVLGFQIADKIDPVPIKNFVEHK